MKEIPLTQGKVALVDDEDFERLSQHKWFAYKHRYTWYAGRGMMVRPKVQRILRMHREILGLKFGDGIIPDHEDGNGLNNQRYNLRIATSTQNIRNQRVRTYPKHSRFKGVTYWVSKDPAKRSRKVWTAQIALNGRSLRIGRFYTEEVAALAYNLAAQRHFGEFARLNSL